MILSTVGFIAESKESLSEFFKDKISSFGLRSFIVALILCSTVLITLGVSLLAKYLSIKKIDGKDGIHIGDGHEHDHIIFNNSDFNPESKKLALFLMLSHRVPGGLILGLLASSIASHHELNSENIIFLISFAIHIVPEELIMYYRQIEMGVPRWKAVKNSIFATMILIPFLIIGAFIGYFLNEANVNTFENVVMPIIQTIAASFLLFTAVIEFFPEFLHFKISGKEWYKTILILIIGIVCALFILSFHSHSFHSH